MSEALSEPSAIVLAKCAYAQTMTNGARKRCGLAVLKLAAATRRTGLGAETYRRLSSAGLIEWVRVGGWRPTAAGIEALAAHVNEPVFSE